MQAGVAVEKSTSLKRKLPNFITEGTISQTLTKSPKFAIIIL
jgi:hypothetical protein